MHNMHFSGESMSSTTIVLITLIAYKVFLLSVGFWASRRVKSEGDFFLAGQQLGAWTAGLSYAASTSSAWVLLGFTGIIYTQGIVGLWLLPGIFGGYFVNWLLLGPRLHAETTERGYITVIDFITGDVDPGWKRWIGILCAALILFCFVFYISSQFQAAGTALNQIFGMNMTEAILLGAIVIVIYCLLGGFWAASISDAFQAAIMMAACILVPFVTVQAAGGMGAVMAELRNSAPDGFFDITGSAAGFAGIGFAMGLIGTGPGSLGQPQLLNRIMAVRSQKERVRAAFITIGWGAVVFSGLVCLAFAGKALKLESQTESLFFVAAETYLPPVLAGLFIAAVLSAVMSTVDSLFLSAASAVSHDMGLSYRDPGRALLAGRLAMVAVAVFAVCLTIFMPKDIFTRVLFSWVSLGAALGPVILTKCLGWRVKSPFIFAAILTGFSIAVTAYYFKEQSGVVEIIEKWGSWAAALIILFIGRK